MLELFIKLLLFIYCTVLSPYNCYDALSIPSLSKAKTAVPLYQLDICLRYLCVYVCIHIKTYI